MTNSKAGRETRPLETDFVRTIKRHRSKGPYDCLVMCSGGKDSTASLYYMKRRYRLNPLAFTFDHGFENEEALANVRRAVDVLDVDYLYHRTKYMHDMFRDIICSDHSTVLCHVCSIWYMGLAFETAARYGIRLIVAGWTRGQSSIGTDGVVATREAPEFEKMSRDTRDFLARYTKHNPRYRDFPQDMGALVRNARRRNKQVVVSPLWFVPDDCSTYTDLIKRELGWAPTSVSYPAGSTNCLLNFLSVSRSMKHYGYTHYHVEMSKLIREGLMTREQAIRDLELKEDPEVMEKIRSTLALPVEGGG